MKCFHIETIRGPWLSFGIHIDWQRPHITFHVFWWIVTVGRLYDWRDGVTDEQMAELVAWGEKAYAELTPEDMTPVGWVTHPIALGNDGVETTTTTNANGEKWVKHTSSRTDM